MVTVTTSEFVADPGSGEGDDVIASARPRGSARIDWIAHHAMHRPAREAVRDPAPGAVSPMPNWIVVSTRRPVSAVARCRARRPCRVLAHNGVEYFDIQFACARTGSICVLLNWRLTVAELEYMVNDSSPSLLVHDSAFSAAAVELQRLCGVAALLCIDSNADVNPYEHALASCDGETGGRENSHTTTWSRSCIRRAPPATPRGR